MNQSRSQPSGLSFLIGLIMSAILAGVLLVCGVYVTPVVAQETDYGHSLFHEYYQYWYNKRGSHCCDERHCRPAEFRWHNGRWEVLLKNGVWYAWDASDEVRDDLGLGPFGSVCDSTTGYVFCVDPPDAGT